MDDHELKRIGKLLNKSVQMATYVSETNRTPLEELGLLSSQMVHINNATKINSIVPFDRQSLAISSSSTVICLVSRAIREKGWREAIDAVCLLRDQYSYEINLLLVGDGPVKDELVARYKDLSFIHFLGFRSDTCNLFAGSDLGILPSYFMGESQPLTLIESLLAGTPYVASDLGDIPKMLSCEEGLAGHLIPIRDSYCNPTDIAESIRSVLDGPQTLEFYRACARSAAKKFSWDSMLLAYEEVYRQVLSN
jgi:glycosyltransferase involved in cell wall biosynthesis